MPLVSCNKGPQTIELDYIFTAEPVVSATNSTVFKNVQEDFALKAEGKRIMQAAVFVNKNVSTSVASKFLANLQSNIQAGKDNPDLIKTSIEELGTPAAQQTKFGIPGAMAKKVMVHNGFSLGFDYAKDTSSEISSFVKILNPSIGDLEDKYIFQTSTYEETEDISSLKILSPTGAPSIALYNYATSENFVTSNNPQTGVMSQFDNDNYDIIIAPSHGGLNKVVKQNANYQIAATITFGNLYIVSTGRDEDATLNEGDKVLYFQPNDLPGKIFSYLYGDLGLDTYYVDTAELTKNAILNNGTINL